MSVVTELETHAKEFLGRLSGALTELKDTEEKLKGLGALVSEARGGLTAVLDKLPPAERAEAEAILSKLTEDMAALLGSTHPAT